MSYPYPLRSSEPSEYGSSVVQSIQGPTPCYFMVVDILGFSKIITNLNGDEQSQRIADWLELVETTSSEVSVEDTQLISDTLFAKEEDSVDGLARLLRFAKLLLERGLDKNFPLRGSIVHGDAAWGKLTYGDAVIEAHQLERSLDWIGVACAPHLPGMDQMWNWNLVAAYAVPRKSARNQIMPAIAWEVPETLELVRRATGNGLFAEGDPIPWETIGKLERTIQFGMYLRIGKSASWDPQRYRGLFPMHLIETYVTGTTSLLKPPENVSLL